MVGGNALVFHKYPFNKTSSASIINAIYLVKQAKAKNELSEAGLLEVQKELINIATRVFQDLKKTVDSCGIDALSVGPIKIFERFLSKYGNSSNDKSMSEEMCLMSDDDCMVPLIQCLEKHMRGSSAKKALKLMRSNPEVYVDGVSAGNEDMWRLIKYASDNHPAKAQSSSSMTVIQCLLALQAIAGLFGASDNIDSHAITKALCFQPAGHIEDENNVVNGIQKQMLAVADMHGRVRDAVAGLDGSDLKADQIAFEDQVEKMQATIDGLTAQVSVLKQANDGLAAIKKERDKLLEENDQIITANGDILTHRARLYADLRKARKQCEELSKQVIDKERDLEFIEFELVATQDARNNQAEESQKRCDELCAEIKRSDELQAQKQAEYSISLKRSEELAQKYSAQNIVLQSEIQKYRERMDELQKENSTLKVNLKNAEQVIANLKGLVADDSKKITDLNNALTAADANMTALTENLNKQMDICKQKDQLIDSLGIRVNATNMQLADMSKELDIAKKEIVAPISKATIETEAQKIKVQQALDSERQKQAQRMEIDRHANENKLRLEQDAIRAKQSAARELLEHNKKLELQKLEDAKQLEIAKVMSEAEKKAIHKQLELDSVDYAIKVITDSVDAASLQIKETNSRKQRLQESCKTLYISYDAMSANLQSAEGIINYLRVNESGVARDIVDALYLDTLLKLIKKQRVNVGACKSLVEKQRELKTREYDDKIKKLSDAEFKRVEGLAELYARREHTGLGGMLTQKVLSSHTEKAQTAISDILDRKEIGWGEYFYDSLPSTEDASSLAGMLCSAVFGVASSAISMALDPQGREQCAKLLKNDILNKDPAKRLVVLCEILENNLPTIQKIGADFDLIAKEHNIACKGGIVPEYSYFMEQVNLVIQKSKKNNKPKVMLQSASATLEDDILEALGECEAKQGVVVASTKVASNPKGIEPHGARAKALLSTKPLTKPLAKSHKQDRSTAAPRRSSSSVKTRADMGPKISQNEGLNALKVSADVQVKYNPPHFIISESPSRRRTSVINITRKLTPVAVKEMSLREPLDKSPEKPLEIDATTQNVIPESVGEPILATETAHLITDQQPADVHKSIDSADLPATDGDTEDPDAMLHSIALQPEATTDIIFSVQWGAHTSKDSSLPAIPVSADEDLFFDASITDPAEDLFIDAPTDPWEDVKDLRDARQCLYNARQCLNGLSEDFREKNTEIVNKLEEIVKLSTIVDKINTLSPTLMGPLTKDLSSRIEACNKAIDKFVRDGIKGNLEKILHINTSPQAVERIDKLLDKLLSAEAMDRRACYALFDSLSKAYDTIDRIPKDLITDVRVILDAQAQRNPRLAREILGFVDASIALEALRAKEVLVVEEKKVVGPIVTDSIASLKVALMSVVSCEPSLEDGQNPDDELVFPDVPQHEVRPAVLTEAIAAQPVKKESAQKANKTSRALESPAVQ